MAQPQKFLKLGVKIFKVLAWVSLALQVITGLVLVIGGGEPVFIAGIDLPARLVGVLNFVAAALYWFSFTLMASVIQLLLDIRAQLPGGTGGH